MEDDREMRDGEAMIPENGHGDRCKSSVSLDTHHHLILTQRSCADALARIAARRSDRDKGEKERSRSRERRHRDKDDDRHRSVSWHSFLRTCVVVSYPASLSSPYSVSCLTCLI